MRVTPAIDILGGRCVRLRQGDYAQETVFSDDPLAMAKQWVEQGANELHIVDLDGARKGELVNAELIGQIAKQSGATCQLGGGIRDDEGMRRAFDLGVDRVVVGTRAVRDQDWLSSMANRYPYKVVLGLDARGGRVATEGWLTLSQLLAVTIAESVDDLPLAGIVYTDINRDGMLQGPNFEAITAVAASCCHPIIASGGIATIDDVIELSRRQIHACILGRSLYEGKIKFPEILAQLQSTQSAGPGEVLNEL